MIGGENLDGKIMKAFMRFQKLKINTIIEGISISDFHILGALHCYEEHEDETGGMKVSELARMMQVSSPSMSRTLNHLEKDGYVCRYEVSNDRRSTYVKLTEEGRKTAGRVEQTMKEYWKAVLARVGEDKVDQLSEVLGELYEAAEEEIALRAQKKKGEHQS